MLCNKCLNRLSHGAKIRSEILNKELKRIRERKFTDEEINYYLASLLKKKADNLKTDRYSTGEQCVNGHISERYTCNSKCVQCCLDMHVRIRAKKALTRVNGRPGWLSRKSPDEIKKIEEAISKGFGSAEIAKMYGCHRNTVINLRRTLIQSNL